MAPQTSARRGAAARVDARLQTPETQVREACARAKVVVNITITTAKRTRFMRGNALLKGCAYSHRNSQRLCLAPGGLEIFLTTARCTHALGCVLSWERTVRERRRPRPAAQDAESVRQPRLRSFWSGGSNWSDGKLRIRSTPHGFGFGAVVAASPFPSQATASVR